MTDGEMLYGVSSPWIAIGLFLLILLANEASYRFAKLPWIKRDEGVTSQTNAIQAGTLGLLALLLGFSFNMALQRFDARSTTVIEEANAIGTTQLRAALLPERYATQMSTLLADYVDLRVAAVHINTVDGERYNHMVLQTQALQAELWRLAMQASDDESLKAPIFGLFVQSLNGMIDSYADRQAQLQKHVPEIVLMLLFVILLVAGSLLGFAAGLNGSRPLMATVSMSALIVLVIFIVIDLDRPRRGLIQIDQSSMLILQRLPGG